MIFKERVDNVAELRDLLGFPTEFIQHKAIRYLDHHCRYFLRLSPMAFLATSDEGGACDVSPRGDIPGFAMVIDDGHLMIPDRPGNRRLDSMLNILSNPHVGLLFVIPGMEETLRINGTAYLSRESRWLEAMAVDGKPPTLGIGVEVEECFIHCAKAFKRSKVWQPSAWPEPAVFPQVAEVLRDHADQPGVSAQQVRGNLERSYRELY